MLTWSWTDKCGYIVCGYRDEDNWTVNLYRGNALMIGIYEYKEGDADMYSMWSFFCDETHAKRCLGLTKDEDYIMDSVKEIHLYADNEKRTKTLIKLWTEAIYKHKLNVKLIIEKGGE